MAELWLPASCVPSQTPVVGQEWERPEWEVTPPTYWEEELRSISPKAELTSYLHFRWYESFRMWVLYELTPANLLDDFRREQLATHWSALRTEGEQVARRMMVSDYQHYMYTRYRVEASPFLILQGPFGGTPAAWSERELQTLKLNQLPQDVPPIGMFEPCEWGPAVIAQIRQRDRLCKADFNLTRLAWANSTVGIKADIEEAEKAYRKAFLSYWTETMGPIADHILSIRKRSEHSDFAAGATQADVADAQQWVESFVDTGAMPRLKRGARTTHAPLIHPVAA